MRPFGSQYEQNHGSSRNDAGSISNLEICQVFQTWKSMKKSERIQQLQEYLVDSEVDHELTPGWKQATAY